MTPRTMRAVACECARLARRWALVFSDTESDYLWRRHLQRAGLEYVRTCFWEKVGGAPQFTGDRPAVGLEAITACHPPGRKRWNGGGKQGLYKVPIVVSRGGPNEVRVHTTQKPEELMVQILADFTSPDDLILDPFGGSGTTAAAAKRLGRRCILIEKEERYCEIAASRLSQRALDLFSAATEGNYILDSLDGLCHNSPHDEHDDGLRMRQK